MCTFISLFTFSVLRTEYLLFFKQLHIISTLSLSRPRSLSSFLTPFLTFFLLHSLSFFPTLSLPPLSFLLSLSLPPPFSSLSPPPPSSAPRLHLGSSLMYPLFVSTKPLYHAARSRTRRRRQKRVTGSHQVSKGANFYLERRERLIGSKTSREGLQGRQHAGYREGGSGRRRGANERQIF